MKQNSITPAVLLLGASSQIGVFVIPRLVRAGLRVLALSRQSKPEHFPEFPQVEWIKPDAAGTAIQDCEHLLSAGPLELALKYMSRSSSFTSSVIFSSSSVISKKLSTESVEKQQIANMLSLESDLCSLAENHSVKLVIFRPTMIYGCGMDANISRLADWIQRFGFLPVNGKAAGLRQPVHADDLANVAVKALIKGAGYINEVHASDPFNTMFLTGASTISYEEMAVRIFAALKKPVRIIHLPQWLFIALIKLAGLFKRNSGINSEMVRRQAIDLVFDSRPARDTLDYKPREFRPVKQDFELPFKGAGYN